MTYIGVFSALGGLGAVVAIVKLVIAPIQRRRAIDNLLTFTAWKSQDGVTPRKNTRGRDSLQSVSMTVHWKIAANSEPVTTASLRLELFGRKPRRRYKFFGRFTGHRLIRMMKGIPLGEHSFESVVPKLFDYERRVSTEKSLEDSGRFSIKHVAQSVEFPNAKSTIIEAVLVLEIRAPQRATYRALVTGENIAYGREILLS